MKEHHKDVFKATNATPAKTELNELCLKNGHVFYYVNTTTIAREQWWASRKFMESRFLRCDPTVCNVNHGPLPDIYGALDK
ncbi:hypothetical protein HPB48_020567 [Haemaphysalis longicornis]|uniref:Uncharacterized protein n=1 Tax=Haemaphysalis longicornis TaxID=44386 RepID=A0A9J6G6Z5_HAELO|nr:hypothetical protein HPB48_020567 [Haemaphysalis longicornis]